MSRRSNGLIRRAALAVLVVACLPATVTRADGVHSLIQGSGSSWSSNALNQWIADVQPNGIQVVYTASGSAQGRKDFGYRTTDFAITETGFLGTDELTGDSDTSQGRAYSYLPIVAGGTSFPYQIRVGGQLVRDLRLSGLTLIKIFTNQITDWSDPAITADNNGRVLPSLPIIPVVHSEGSGTTAHLTDYFDKQFPDIWRTFNGAPGLTEYYPREGATIAQSGSEGVMNFVTSSAANGAIGYDEYSYPLGKNYPVAKLQNAAGYFALPSQYNVAVALTQAIIDQDVNSPNYLLQDLTNVYTYSDPRTYILSSYSYMVIPTAPDDSKMTTAKRQTIADFLYYSICDGQREMGPIGYSPLPVNLVQAGFAQIGRLHDADRNVDLTQRDVSTCHNPTFDPADLNKNRLAEIAPQPLACDRVGQALCPPGAVAQAPPDTTPSATTPTTTTAPAAPGNAPAPVDTAVSNTDPADDQVAPPAAVPTPAANGNGGRPTTNGSATTVATTVASGPAATTDTSVATTVVSDPTPTVDAATVTAPAVAAPVGGSTTTTLVAPQVESADAPSGLPVVVVRPAGGDDASPAGAPLEAADVPRGLVPSPSNGFLWPIVIGLVVALVVAPAVRITVRRRKAVG